MFEENEYDLLRADITTPVQKNGICFDGIIDETVFESQKYPKVMFLLKETNGHVNGHLPQILPNWDYRGWLEHQQANNIESNDPMNSNKFYGAAFNKLCMWTDLLHDCFSETVVPYEEYKVMRYNQVHFREVLKRVAIINLKKTWGGSQTEWQHLNSYLNQDGNDAPKRVLHEELIIIDPAIVICGGRETFDFAKEIFYGEEQVISLEDGNKLSYFMLDGKIFLDFYHPSCRGEIAKLYDYAIKRFFAVKTLL